MKYLILAVVFAGTVMGSSFTLCSASAGQGGYGGQAFSSSSASGVCNTSVTMTIPDALGYARLAWDSSSAGYPSGLTLGNFGGGTGYVTVAGNNQPFYMLAFTDPSKGLGQTNAADQILMIEFQSAAASGGLMPLDPNATLFNLYDNTAGFYMAGGQQDTHTLSGWMALYPFLSGESLQQVRIGMGMAGGAGAGGSVTVNAFVGEENLATPEPGALGLVMAGLMALGVGRIKRRN